MPRLEVPRCRRLGRTRRPATAASLLAACTLVAAAAPAAVGALRQEPAAAASRAPAGGTTAGETAEQPLVNPLPATEQAIASGRKHYLRYCQTCHGYDGRALENIDFEAADLTNPEVWRFGTTDGDIFRNTKDGAGQDMPPFGTKLEDRELWELVHYLRSIGPEKLRPKPVEETPP